MLPQKSTGGPPQTDPSDAPEARFTFSDMNLKAGDRIQLAPPPNLGSERYIVKLIGYLDRVSVLVTAPTAKGLRVPLQKDDAVIARAFSGQNAFGFACTITCICRAPFDYLHLSFPEEIQGAVIRKSARVKITIIASIFDPDNAGGEPVPGMIVNISSSGGMVDTPRPLGEKGQKVRLTFRVKLHRMDVVLTTNAIIRSIVRDDETDDKAQPAMVHHGIEFQDLQPNDCMILQSLIYQHIVEQPHTLI